MSRPGLHPRFPINPGLGQAEAKNGWKGGRRQGGQPVWPLPLQLARSQSPLPLPGLGLGFWVEQQHYGINHHHHHRLSHCVLSPPSPLFQGCSKADCLTTPYTHPPLPQIYPTAFQHYSSILALDIQSTRHALHRPEKAHNPQTPSQPQHEARSTVILNPPRRPPRLVLPAPRPDLPGQFGSLAQQLPPTLPSRRRSNL